MCRVIVTMVLFCVIVAAPVVADWTYMGTGAEVSDPFYWEAPDGTCGNGWNGSGCTVAGEEHTLTVEGTTWGEAWAWLTPDYGLSRDPWAASHVFGWSDYEYAGGSRNVQASLEATFAGSLKFSGDCLDRTGTCDASAYSDCSAWGELMNPAGRPGEGDGACHGRAYSTGGSYAYTDPWNVTPDPVYNWAESEDIVDFWGDPMGGWYEGRLDFTGTLSATFESDVNTTQFRVSAEVGGSCQAGGRLVINDPNVYWGGFNAAADYYSDGTCEVEVNW